MSAESASTEDAEPLKKDRPDLRDLNSEDSGSDTASGAAIAEAKSVPDQTTEPKPDTGSETEPDTGPDAAPAAPAIARFARGPSGEGQLVSTDDNQVPDGAISGYFDGLDLARIRYARWEGEADAVKATGGYGTVCVFTGRADFIEKYFETIEDLRRRGFDVAIMDWRGQGRSARLLGNPRKGHITSFDQYHGDLVHFMREVVLPDCRPPYFALAHSMGGAVLLHAAARRQPWFRRMVLSAPMLRLAGRRLSTRSIRRLSEIACYAGLDGLYVPGKRRLDHAAMPFSGNVLTSDQSRFTRNQRILKVAPELGVGAPTIGWIHAATQAMETLTHPEFAGYVRTPVLMAAAGKDALVSSRTIEQVGARLRGGGTINIDGARHELLMERDRFRELFWAAFDAFVPGSGDWTGPSDDVS